MAKKKNKTPRPQRQQRNKREITQNIISHFNNHPNESMNYKQVAAGVEATLQVEIQAVISILETLLAEDFLVLTGRGKYRLNSLSSIAEGTFERRSNGKNSFLPNDGGNPIFVAERNSLSAMNKDAVRVQIFARRKGREPEAEVIEILQHRQDTVVGVLEVSKYYAYLIVDSKLWANDIFIPKDKIKDGRSGQKAVVRIIEWPDKKKNPVGEVVDILGDTGNNQAEMHAILAEFGLPYQYPEALEKAARKIPAQPSRDEIAQREDFRQTLTFTIDPADAKDFDDALSLRRLSNGNWEVGVHIADVTYYVKPDSAIDKEAAERATSVYLVDRTIPMLPELLSNDLCSLRPNEDKLCYSVIFEMNSRAEIKQYRIRHTLIHSDRRLNYDEAQAIIERGSAEGEAVAQAILDLHQLALILRKKRFDHGAVNFERAEAKFDIDSDGKPLRVYFREEKEANRLIEEFMLLANKTVAECIGKTAKGVKPKTFIYRVHDEPNPEKLANFLQFVRRLGYKIKDKAKSNEMTQSINRLLAEVQGKKEQNLIETVAVRAMAKALYTTVNIGHFGLAFEHYTHFTSPIRRYPDMMVHRLLDRYLAGGRSVPEAKTEDACKHCSNMETLASQAERASIKYKQVEFMSERIGLVFDGVISGVTEWGLYVELTDNHCEGMIPMRELDDDYYEFDEQTYSLVGKRKHKRYTLGDPMRICVARANLEKKQLDFTPEK